GADRCCCSLAVGAGETTGLFWMKKMKFGLHSIAITVFSLLSLLSLQPVIADDAGPSVLMLGDSGCHRPSEFYRHVAEPLDHRTWSNVNFQNLLVRGVLWTCGKTLTAAVDGGDEAADSQAKA